MFELGRETEIKAAGRTWRVGRLTLGVFERFFEWIAEQVGDPFRGLEKLVPLLPPDRAMELVNEAREKRDALELLDVGSPLVHRYQRSVRGLTHLLHLLLLEHQPQATLDDAWAVLVEIGAVQAGAAVEAAGGGNAGAPPAR